MRMTDLRPGWAVLGNDGRRIGTIKTVGQNYIVTARAASADLYVPATFVANVEREAVHLNITQRDVDQMGWEQEPREADEPETGSEGDLHRHF